MRLKIRNINKVQNAEIKLDGLTVIAGANSSGKSTVGKLLFTMIKSIANTDALGKQSRERKLKKRVEALYKRVNGCFSRYHDPEMDALFPLPSSKMIEQLQSLEDDALIEDFLYHIFAWVESKDITPRLKSLFRQDLDNIKIAMGDSKAADIASEVRVFIESEFMNRICSYGYDYSEATLQMDTSDEAISFEFENDSVKSVNINYSTSLNDATYVESPLYLHILDTLLWADTYREYKKKPRLWFRGMVPIHIKDFASKMEALRVTSKNADATERIGLMDIMGGRFVFDDETKALKFVNKDIGVDFSPINIASGIKTFGIIQILLETQIIGNNKILIWDEPENHLHPHWQVAFAEVLVKLAKDGIPVVVSTHSPYFVQGIRYFSAKEKLENYTNYYLAEEQGNHLSEIKDVTDDLNQIFIKLAEPLSEIMNVDSIRRETK